MSSAQQCLAVAIAITLATLFPASPCSAAWAEEHADFPFVLRADAALPNAPAILSELHDLQDDLVEALGIDPATDWIEIYVYRNRAALDQFAADLLPGVDARPAWFIQGRGPAMILVHRGDTLAIDLRHETTHALLHQRVKELPLWLDEGLAEYFEEPADRRQHHHPHSAALREPGATAKLPTLEQLESKSDLAALQLEDYQAAWSWTHRLLHGPAALRAELRAFLADTAESRAQRPLSTRLRAVRVSVDTEQRRALLDQLPSTDP